MSKAPGKCGIFWRLRGYKDFVTFVTFVTSLTFVTSNIFAQEGNDIEFTLELGSPTISLPKIFRPSIDLSGRGLQGEIDFPQSLSDRGTLDTWQKDIGFNGLYRLQYNLWEIYQLSKDKEAQDKLLANYEGIIKKVNDAGGIVILDIFGTPAGLGKVLDKKSAPWDLKAFKQLVKGLIRDLSCNKRYNIWYEVWNAPDSDDFFLGRGQEYLNIYRAVGESANELEEEMKLHIPVGGPSVSWWFQNPDGNTVVTSERSLIYELIKFCYHYRLPLDFISWHGYSTDPLTEKASTIYKNKSAVTLIRDWLSYFHFDRNLPLIVDEWNYDRDANILAERGEKSFVCASYIPSRIKNMYEAGIDYQLYFCLEDFQNNKEGIIRNVGVFSFDPEYAGYKSSPKCIYNVFRMLASLGSRMFPLEAGDEFAGVIATNSQDYIALLVYNYIDQDVAINYLSRNIAALNSEGRKALLGAIKAAKLEKIIQGPLDIAGLRAPNKVKAVLKKARQLNELAKKYASESRNIKLSIKGIKEDYQYLRYAIDSSCSLDCEFAPAEQKEISGLKDYQETLSLSPYSVQMIILKKKTPATENPAAKTE